MERIRVTTGEVSDARVAETMASRVQDMVAGYAVLNALFALVENDVLDEFPNDAPVDPAEVAKRRNLDAYQLTGVCKFLSLQDVLVEKDGKYWTTPLGRNLISIGARGVLELYRGGYGDVMQAAGPLMNRSKVYGKDIVRHGKWVASGSTGFFRSFNFPAAFSAIERAGGRRVLDLGCGDASFLIDYCRRHPEGVGVGVDVDERATNAAKEAIAKAGLSDRIRIILGNAFQPDVYRALVDEVDVIHSFAMQHEMFRDGEEAVIAHINDIARCFKGKSYVLGEPLLNMVRADSVFYWIHVLSLQGMPRGIDGWAALLGRCDVKLEAVFYAVHEKLSNGGYFLLRL